LEAAAEQRPCESGGGTPDPTSPLPWSASWTPDPTSPPSPSTNGMPDPTSPPSPSASRMSDPTPPPPPAGLRECDAGSHPAAAGLHERYDGSVAPCPRPPRCVCHPPRRGYLAATRSDLFPLLLSSLSYLGFNFSVSSHGFKSEMLPSRKGEAEA